MNLQKFDVQVSGHYPDEDDRIYGNDGEFVDADIAQDLYEALQRAIDDDEMATRKLGGSMSYETRVKARVALAKARGER